MPVFVREGFCFDGTGCDGVQQMEEEEADEFLEENSKQYMGYLSIDENPGLVLFAKFGTSMFKVEGYSCHLFTPELTPADEDSDPEEGESSGEDENGLYSSSSLPEAYTNMTGFRRPGRGQGLLDNQQITLFRSIDASDILQGGLGDCWLLSAFAAMAEYPNALLSLFKERSATDNGEYEITLFNFLQGQYQTLRLDDRLPYIQGVGGCQCAYVKPTAAGEIWTCLLEKAFATMFDNSYKTISGGVSTTAFAALCGVGGDKLAYISRQSDAGWVLDQPVLDSWRPYANDNFQPGTWPDGTPGNQPKPDLELHAMLCQWDQNNYIMCANTQAGSDAEFSTQGIVQGHAYTLIGARREIGEIRANLVQVRNPWGRKEWTGPWSDKSSEWDENPDVKDILNPQASEDGAFWIDIQDFADNYPSIAVVFKDMGANYEKVSNPKADDRSRQFEVGAALPGSNLGIDFPQKEVKLNVKKKKKNEIRARQSTSDVCSHCSVA
mmetsp:Transcript_10206/g.32184  ORF Transcript_10206/g.32184 Transcript_10206/m.32184 type:complete len:495 (-) Transcript_10206:70-1554(-)